MEIRLKGYHSSKIMELSKIPFQQKKFRNALFWGSVPPHQGALIGPEAHKILNSYSNKYQLASDLDYFFKDQSN